MPCPCGCADPDTIVKSGIKKGCCKFTPDPLYVPVYVPKCCPEPRNRDPKRKEFYQKPLVSRSEPLSGSEYLRQIKTNNTQALSSGNTKRVTVGEGEYKRTIWTTASGACSLDSDLVLPAVPPVLGRLQSRDAWQYTEMKGAYAGRGTVSKFDSVNRTEDMTRLRRQGLAIAADSSFMAPARGKRVICEVCTLVGTTDVDPGSCGICGPESAIVSPVRAGSLYFSGVGGGWLQDSSPTLRTSLPQGSTNFTTEFFIKCAPAARQRIVVAWGTTAGGQYNGIKLNGDDSINSYFYSNDTSIVFSPLTDGQWHHIAVQWNFFLQRRRVYADGILMLDDFVTPNVTGYGLQIGHSTIDGGNGSTFEGYISNVRITNGVPLYDGGDTQFPNFDVTSGPFSATQPATNNVGALTGGQTAALLNMNYHYPTVDSSTYGIDMDISGGVVKSSRENPFSGPGSLYFHGTSGIHLKVDNDVDFRMRTGDFTIEWFMRMPAATIVYPRVFSIGSYPNTSIGVSIEGSSHTFIYWYNGVQHVVGNCNPTAIANGWIHYAVTRSDNITHFFQNGAQLGSTFYDSTDYNDRGNSLFIGNQDTTPFGAVDAPFIGYISNFRWTKGTAVYTNAFTVPSVPLVALPNTKLLLLAQTNDTAVVDSSGLGKVVLQNGVTWSISTPTS